MALNIKNQQVENLANEVAALTGENKTEAIRKALEERKERLSFQVVPRNRESEVLEFLEREVWPHVPPELLGKGIPPTEHDALLGYGPEGV